jgi:hypothetical protein
MTAKLIGTCYVVTSMVHIHTYLHIYLRAYSLTPWGRVLENLTGSQLVKKFPAFLWNTKAYYLIHKCQPPLSTLRKLNAVHTPTCHFLKIRLNIIHPSTPGSTKVAFFLQVFPPKPCTRLSPPPYALHDPPISFSVLSPAQ